jgi:hypothetical protein
MRCPQPFDRETPNADPMKKGDEIKENGHSIYASQVAYSDNNEMSKGKEKLL